MMRNAVLIDNQYVVTVDNAGCIGEKERDCVKVSNEITAYYTARVGLLEQWCAGSHPTHLFLSNFTGDAAWTAYEKGIEKAFIEIGEKMPKLSGSTESNFPTLQSGISLMMVGKIVHEVSEDACEWFVIGKPLVGQEVIDHEEDVVKLKELYLLIKLGIIKTIWPVGSKGLGVEFKRLFKNAEVDCSLPLQKSSGPATCVIAAVKKEDISQLKDYITSPIEQLNIK